MKYVIIIVMSLVVLVGCQPNPKYRTGNASAPGAEEKKESRYKQEISNSREFKSLTTDDLIELGRIIQSYLGTPYSGSSRYERGLDCSQFTVEVFDRFKRIKLPRTTDDQFRTGQKISKSKLRYGDLVFFRTDNTRVSHVGIYVGNNEFAHSSSSNGIIISNMHEDYWRKRYVGGRRILP